MEDTDTIAFFNRDDISHQTPGKIEVKSVKDSATGKRELVQKRYMMMTVMEAYHLFREEHPTPNVFKTAFFNQRPKHVIIPISMTPHNVCVCRYHANFDYLIDSLSQHFSTFPKTTKQFLSEMCCNIESEECMSGACNNCI